jgi:hypothetical protein
MGFYEVILSESETFINSAVELPKPAFSLGKEH